MNTVEKSYNITKADNGYIINQSVVEETQKDDNFNATYTNATYVFTSWDSAIEWLNSAETSSV